MTTFKISKDEANRLAAFGSYAKSFSTVIGLEDKHAFVLDATTSQLEAYAFGPQGQLFCAITLSDVVVDPTIGEDVYFVSSSSSIGAACDKVQGDEVTISVDHKRENKLTFKGQGRSTVSLNPNVKKSPDEIKELRTKYEKEGDSYNAEKGVVVNFTDDLKRNFSSMAAISKIIGRTNDVEISSGGLKTADELCIASITSAIPDLSETVYVPGNFAPLLRDVKEFMLYGSDRRKMMFEVPSKGFYTLINLGDSTYEFPTDAELANFLPEAADEIEVEIATEDFYKALGTFDDIFEASKRRYKQVRIKYDEQDFLKTQELEVSFDDLSAECQQYLKADIVSKSSSLPSFQFTIATAHLTGALREPISSSDKIRMKFNGLKITDDHGCGVEFRTNDLDVVVPKMVE